MTEQSYPYAHRRRGSARSGRSGQAMPLQSVHVGRREAIAGDAPIPTVNLLDNYPGDGPEILALDIDHRVGNLSDHLLLLLGREDSFDQLHCDHRHCGFSLLMETTTAIPSRPTV